MKFSRAFTVIELIFVIVVLGILAAVALPKFAATREIADIAKGRGDVATIRTAIANERQSRVILGTPSYPTAAELDAGGLFGGVLTYPMANSATSGNWSGGNGAYKYWVGTTDTDFSYDSDTGKLECTAGADYCDELSR